MNYTVTVRAPHQYTENGVTKQTSVWNKIHEWCKANSIECLEDPINQFSKDIKTYNFRNKEDLDKLMNEIFISTLRSSGWKITVIK